MAAPELSFRNITLINSIGTVRGSNPDLSQFSNTFERCTQFLKLLIKEYHKTEMLYWLTHKIIVAYTYSTLAFLLLRIFNRIVRHKTESFLNIANIFILATLLINMILILLSTFECWTAQNELIQKSSADGYDFYNSSCFIPLLWTAILAFAFQLCFIFRKFRVRISNTIVSVALLLLFTNLEKIMIFVTSLFRDYLPSSWSVYYNDSNNLWALLFSTLYFLFCWIFPHFKLRPQTR